jgi:hypothetical protein
MELFKKLFLVLALVLAINFLALAGGVGYLFQSKKLDNDKLKQIRDIVFAKPEVVEEPKKDEVDPATTRPVLRLERLLEQTAGQSAADQVSFIQSAFETQSAVLERQRREVLDLQKQVELAQNQLTKDRGQLASERADLEKRERDRQLLAADQGFQQALEVYNGLPTKQVKDIFKTMDEQTVVRYLQSMEPRRASRVLREFKAPDELAKAQSLLELLRKNDPNLATSLADAN